LVPAVGWLLGRAWTSEVFDYARADALLVGACIGTAAVVAVLRPGGRTLALLFAGLAVVSLLNLAIGVVQVRHPEFMWPYHHRPSERVTGFFGHYNYFSCFSYTVGLLLAARGLFSKDRPALRALFLITALGSLAMVPVSGSRGGTLALGAGVLVLLACGGALAWRHGAWWSKLVLVLFPLCLVGVGMAGWGLLSRVEKDRMGEGDLSAMADNACRLEWMELAMTVSSQHPWTGGGSRAYSWESRGLWDVGNFGRGGVNERFVHNELLQLLADYGALGVLLVLLPVGVVGWFGLSRLFLGGDHQGGDADATAAGVLAAGAAMLTQSNFSFIFHMLPPAMLLGLVFGLGTLLPRPVALTRPRRALRVLTCGGLAIAVALVGTQATRALHQVWPVLYGKMSLVHVHPREAVDRLEAAAGFWPGHRMCEEAGDFSRIAGAEEADPEIRRTWNLRAVEFYRQAIASHPYDPGLELNRANALSELGEADAAEQGYLRAIELQGGLEAAFESRYYYAGHLFRLWYQRWTDPGQRRAEEALWHFERALALLDEAKAESLWELQPQKELRRQIGEAVAFLRGARVVPRPPVTE
jgi:hypothetical protein